MSRSVTPHTRRIGGFVVLDVPQGPDAGAGGQGGEAFSGGTVAFHDSRQAGIRENSALERVGIRTLRGARFVSMLH
jgi:hypothetical protein